MASTQNSETPATEQVITEIFAKSLHIILESRSPYVSSRNYSLDQIPPSPSSSGGSPSTQPGGSRDKWFNLALRECPAALQNSDFWRQSNLEPLVIEILLVDRVSGTEKLLERWVVQYETRKHPGTGRKSKRTYRGATLLFRSLYLLVRLLPAYTLFREMNSSGRIRSLGLSHRIQSFVNPLTRSEEAEMAHLCLTPIETPFGRLKHSVSYLSVVDDISIGSELSTPMSTELIPDYVGSPTTDPLKRFQTLPLGGSAPICVQPGRRHSWSTDRLGSLNLSPCSLPTHSDPQRPSIPLPLSEVQKGKRPVGCYPSSLSSPQKANLFRCESAPVSRDSERNQLVRFGELPSGVSLPKEISIGGDAIRYLDVAKLPLASGSCVGGSNVQLLDLHEDSDANYPFASDDNKTKNYEGERSLAAIVGELLQMLETAPKLQIGFEKSDGPDQNPNPAHSGSRTAANALEELRSYMHMRDSILSQSGSHSLEPKPEKESNSKGSNSEKEMKERNRP
ncbi:Autophagy-related protein 13 [Rhynchospora pubera]|uniref:Autophagy-related protein 13 n=1 Tax=Rhynchospora pubera TaxID=906938 RepID=A0AAV8HWK1_9POAL|nr:Autophagy-related protein 13 [Rhynchospora pubera]